MCVSVSDKVAELSQMAESIAIGYPSERAWSSAHRALVLVLKRVVCTYLMCVQRKVHGRQQRLLIQSNSPCRNRKRHSKKTKRLTSSFVSAFRVGRPVIAEVRREEKTHQVRQKPAGAPTSSTSNIWGRPDLLNRWA